MLEWWFGQGRNAGVAVLVEPPPPPTCPSCCALTELVPSKAESQTLVIFWTEMNSVLFTGKSYLRSFWCPRSLLKASGPGASPKSPVTTTPFVWTRMNKARWGLYLFWWSVLYVMITPGWLKTSRSPSQTGPIIRSTLLWATHPLNHRYQRPGRRPWPVAPEALACLTSASQSAPVKWRDWKRSNRYSSLCERIEKHIYISL